jgi:hypothetical protein
LEVGGCMVEVRFFETPADFRGWLEAHHDTETELCVCQPGMAHFDAREWPTPGPVVIATFDDRSVGRLTSWSQA